ncbi:MAG TPA: hypothetical protein VM100_14260 [Longimicrobiales bacterium]|nr:hypothetical protein [Longimicrobiales bacterium]
MLSLAILLTIPVLTLDPVHGDFEAQFKPNAVYISLEIHRASGNASWAQEYAIKELGDVSRSGRVVSFKLPRDAGTLTFKGEQSGDRSSGAFVFTPSQAFAARMQKLGYSGLTQDRLLTFALADLSIADVKYLDQQTADELETADLIRMVNHGVTVEFLRGIIDAGYAGSIDPHELVDLRDHGVTPTFVRQMNREYGRKLLPRQLVQLRDLSISNPPPQPRARATWSGAA